MVDDMHRASGQCLCGAITYRVLGDLREVFNCHCARCRRFTGHHMAATATAATDLSIEDNDSNLRWYYPVPEAGYAFCQTCGSSLFWQSKSNPASTSICAGSLDPPTNIRTTQAWWTSEASDYHTRPNVPEFDAE